MDSMSLDDILQGKDSEPPAQPKAEAPAEKGEAEPKGKQPVVTELALPEGEEAAPPAAQQQDEKQVPLAALEAERKQRQDYKSQLAAREAELAEVRKQLEELKAGKPAQPPQQPGQPAAPDMFADPQAYSAWQAQQTALAAWSAKADVSEALLREQIGDRAVDALAEKFKALVGKRPDLQAELLRQRMPWHWVKKQVEAEEAKAEIGDDPKSYRDKLREELKAQILAEMQDGVQPPVAEAPPAASAASIPPSLATLPSAQPRSMPAFSGPTPLDAIIKP